MGFATSTIKRSRSQLDCPLQPLPTGNDTQQFYAKWKVTQEELALICSRSISTVQRWFTRGHNYQCPTANDLRHLALMDFLLEHFDEIPKVLFDLLCSPTSGNKE